MTWLTRWLAAIGAFLAALGAAVLYGRSKGKAAERVKTRAAQDAATVVAEQVHAHEVRNEVEAEVQKLPDAPAQAVGAADPATSAGRLRDDGWTRD